MLDAQICNERRQHANQRGSKSAFMPHKRRRLQNISRGNAAEEKALPSQINIPVQHVEGAIPGCRHPKGKKVLIGSRVFNFASYISFIILLQCMLNCGDMLI